MNTYQNIINMITITLCLLMTGVIIFLVNVNKDLEQQVFEVDNLQSREDITNDGIGVISASVGKVADAGYLTQKEIESLKKRDLEQEAFIKDFWVLVNTEFPELWEKIRFNQNTNTEKDITVDELNAEIERQLKALDKEIKNAK